MNRDLYEKKMEMLVLSDTRRGVIDRFEIIMSAAHWIVGRWLTISDETSLSMAAENRLDTSRRNRKRRHCRCARWIHDNVRKKVAKDYQERHEPSVQRNIRNSRRALQYLQWLRNDAWGVSSKLFIV